MSQAKWVEMGRPAAERLAEETGRAVVFAADAAHGYARPLGDGETEEEAIRDFEAAGEPCERVRVFGAAD